MDTRNTIIAAATDAFARQGYHKTSIDQIAKAAGVSKGAVYYFFENKAALFLAIVQEGMAYLEGRIATVRTSDAPTGQAFRQLVSAYVSIFRSYPKIVSLLFAGRTEQLEPALAVELQTIALAQTRDLSALIQDGIDEGLLRPIKPEWVVSAFIGMVAELCAEPTISPNHALSEAEATQVICTLILDGLRLTPEA